MKTLRQTLMGFAVLAVVLCVGATARAEDELPGHAHQRHGTKDELPTQRFRNEHAVVRKHLAHMAALVGQLRTQPAQAQRNSMRQVVTFFQEHIKPHAAWEAEHLYPVVDRLAQSAPAHPFTSTMRFEHGVIGKWIDALDAEAKKAKPDVTAFSRRADNLFGLLDAHFDEEEQVLLPLIDAEMTAAEFEKAVGGGHGAQGH